MIRPDLRLVRPPAVQPQLYDEQKGLKRITLLKAQLMAASVRYVADGKDGTRNDRLRTASSASGIPLTLIEVQLGKETK